MKKSIMYLVALVSLLTISCTKHYPFDTLDKAEEGDNLWILSKFAKTNVIDFEDNNITFFESNTAHAKPEWDYSWFRVLPEADTRAYYSHDELRGNGLLNRAVPDGKGGYYRLPTVGELAMIIPMESDEYTFGILRFCEKTRMTETVMETVYIDNNEDSTKDTEGEVISGESSFFYAVDYPDSEQDFHPVFAVRFKGTTQYAAYRYDIVRLKKETVSNDDGEQDWVLWALRLRAVRLPSDAIVDFDDIVNEDYFKSSGAIELVLPMLTQMDSYDYLYDGGYGQTGRLVSSTINENLAGVATFRIWPSGPGQESSGYAYIAEKDSYATNMQYPIRLIKCKSDGTL